jgi:hypothetical protein
MNICVVAATGTYDFLVLTRRPAIVIVRAVTPPSAQAETFNVQPLARLPN